MMVDIFTWADPEKAVRGGSDNILFSHHPISQRAVRTSLEKQLGARGPIAASQWGVCTSISKETYNNL